MIKQRALDDFRSTIRGDVLLPHDPDYDATRQIFNAMIDAFMWRSAYLRCQKNRRTIV